MKKINKYEDISQKFLNEIQEEEIIEFNIKSIPYEEDFLILINHIVLQRGAIIFDKINNQIIKKDTIFSNSYSMENDENKVKIKRYQYGQKISENNENYLLPIGSVVELTGADKMIITGRAIVQEFDGKNMYTDYLGYSFPLGQINEEKYVFNHEDIKKLLHVGLQTEETDEVDLSIKEWLNSTDIHKYISEK